jgi:uncharacterized protein YwgA
MMINDALLFTYDAAGGSIQGKTNLQKKMYFVAVMLGKDFGYGAHYYGPYSATVAAANQELKSLGYLSESTASAGSYNASGFEIARHDFQLTADGRSVLDAKKTRLPEDWIRVEKAVKRLSQAGDLNYMELSIAAKAYFLLKQATKASDSKLVKQATKFGWTVTEDEIRKAVEFLIALELAKAVD